MGMFDSLYVQCRNCSTALEFQSKAGECACNRYTLQDCPAEIAGSLDGDSETCSTCGTTTTLRAHVFLVVE